MRLPALAAATLTAAALSSAPGYQVTTSTGDHDFFYTFRGASTAAMASAPDNSLSSWQPLPFTWKLFGQEVRGYYISDNGYITFDSTAKASVAANTALPSAAAPRGSIFAYWTDLEMTGGTGQWTNTVRTGTFGTAPNRVHVIYWMSLVPKGTTFATSALSFAVALHENGEFEVIYTVARKSGMLGGTVGATSLDGAATVMAAGPAFEFPAVGFGGEDDQAFRFKPVVP